MKKLLSLIGLVGLTVPSVITVVSCNQQTAEEKLFNQKLAVFKTVQSIVEEGITFNDEFLLNYDLGLNGTEEQKAAFKQLVNDEFKADSTGIFSKLLAKIIYEKLLENIPDLRQQFPDISLVVYFNNFFGDLPIGDAIPKVINGEEAKLKYKVGINFSSYDLIDKLDYGKKNYDKPDINENQPFWDSLRFETNEFLIDGSLSKKLNFEQPVFTFKQKKMISDSNKWINYYTDLYNNFSLGKALVTDLDTFHNFSKFWVFSIDSNYKKFLGLSANENIVKIIAESNNPIEVDQKKYLVQQTIIDKISSNSQVNFKTYKLLNLIDNFLIEKLDFAYAYTADQLLLDKNLKRSFYLNASDFFIYNGIMTFDISLKFGIEGYDDKIYKERIYVIETSDFHS